MSPDPAFMEWNDDQRRVYAAAVQLYEAYLQAVHQARALKGGMHWKRIKGRDYLYQYRDRFGHGRSLGPRSQHTEQLCAAFARQRQELAARLQDQRPRLAQQARFCRAALIHRVPPLITRILRHLGPAAADGREVTVMGTTAIYAYEFAAGAFLAGPQAAASFADSSRSLTLVAAPERPPAELLHLLRRADRSFQAVPGEDFRAANRHGFLVKVLPTGAPGHGDPAGPRPRSGGSLQCLVSSPRFSQVVIGKDGAAVTLSVPDPRAFALHKLWLSQQEGREASKKPRDRSQAMAVAELILRYLPQYHFFSSELRLFPEEVIRKAGKLSPGDEFGPDLDIEY